jgi:alpha-glucosidase
MTGPDWIRHAVIYQLYLRSFADGNGDGIGDLAGLRAHLDHLVALNVDAVWLNPWFPSPMHDAGYDVADYRDIDPVFGTLPEADAFVAQAHAAGIRVLIDLVPNHCSIRHPWFAAALATGPGSPERARFWFRPGRGPGGDLPPNNWESIFTGPAWTRVIEPDGRPGEWYLHLFSPEQPDFDWNDGSVQAEFLDVLRFWLDRGVDGVRIDSPIVLVKDPTLADARGASSPGPDHPFLDRDGGPAIFRRWRQVAASYTPERVLVGEVWLEDTGRFRRYLADDVLHGAFSFSFLGCRWDAGALRRSIDETLAVHAGLGPTPSWVLSNHDVTRHVTRYGRADTDFTFADRRHGTPVDLELGARRARAAVLLMLALPGSACLYQGEELGLEEVEDLPREVRQDPAHARSGYVDPGRDGCRVPIPWSGEAPPFGFSPAGAAGVPWLPQPGAWARLTVARQSADAGSMLRLYRDALALRRCDPALSRPAATITWLPSDDGVLAFARDPGLICMVNLSADPVALPTHQRVVLASVPLLTDGSAGLLLAPDSAVWLRTADPS